MDPANRMFRLEKQTDPSPGGLKLEDLPCDSEILEPARRGLVCCPSDFRPSLDHQPFPRWSSLTRLHRCAYARNLAAWTAEWGEIRPLTVRAVGASCAVAAIPPRAAVLTPPPR